MWGMILSFLGGPILNGLINAYKARLDAGNTQASIAADLAGRELAVQQLEVTAQAQLKVAEIGHWYEPEKLFAYSLWIYFSKIFLYDAAFGYGSTDAVHGDASYWASLVIGFYFGKRGIENVARIIKR